MTTQDIVNEIRQGFKEDWILTVWYRSEKNRVIKRVYESADVLAALSVMAEFKELANSDRETRMLLDGLRKLALDPLDSLFRKVHVGSTPLPEETENNEWKGGIGS